MKRADQKRINKLALARQFALTAVKLQMFGGKTRHVWHPIRTCFFVSCPRLDATDGINIISIVSAVCPMGPDGRDVGRRVEGPESRFSKYGKQILAI